MKGTRKKYDAKFKAKVALEAKELINNYIARLDSYNLDEIKSEEYWDTVREFIYTERRWAKQMNLKLGGM